MEKNRMLKKFKHSIVLQLMVITVLALAVRYFRYCSFDRVERDSILYITMAEKWSSDGIGKAYELCPWMPPLLIVVMGAGDMIGIGAETTGVLFNLLCGALLPLAVFLIGSCLFKEDKFALFAAFLIAVHPYLIHLSALIMRDAPYWTFAAFALAFMTMAIKKRMERKSFLFWGISGFFTILAVLTRREGLELLAVIFLWLPVNLWLPDMTIKQKICHVSLAFLSFFFVFLGIGIPVERGIINSSKCTWRIIDPQIISFLQSSESLKSTNSGL